MASRLCAKLESEQSYVERAVHAHTDISRRRYAETATGEVEPISRFFKLPPDGLSNTLRAGTDGARGAFTSPRPIHYEYDRCITVREMARLHGFPDWFRFHATKWHGARQIGNAVPPPLARAIAGAVVKALGLKPERPAQPIDLGDPALLYMEMSEAAERFGVSTAQWTARPQERRKEKETTRDRGNAEAFACGEWLNAPKRQRKSRITKQLSKKFSSITSKQVRPIFGSNAKKS